jgi:hypothetical protein
MAQLIPDDSGQSSTKTPAAPVLGEKEMLRQLEVLWQSSD